MKTILLVWGISFGFVHARRSYIDLAPNMDATRDLINAETENCECVRYYECRTSPKSEGNEIVDIRLMSGPCEHYLDVCCKPSLIERDNVTQRPVTQQKGCGNRNPNGLGFRIVGNVAGESEFGEFPWMVAILLEEDNGDDTVNLYKCGGALINPEVVLTAAHCVFPEGRYKIRAGEWDTQTTNELFLHQDVYVKETQVHPRYYAGALHNDAALLFLESALILGDNIGVICLPRENDRFDYVRCWASGWGKDVFDREGQYQVILKKVELPIVPHGTCEEKLRRTRLTQNFKLHESFICAGGDEGVDTCRGDGGSPLACPISGSDRYAQVGIVSWGINCGRRDTPGVYANVAYFRTWIDEQLRTRNLDTSTYDSR